MQIQRLNQRFSAGLLDFHTHSVHSDGGDTPAELVRKAKKEGVFALALTDHNVISGLGEFNEACRREGIFGIPFGVEIYSCLPSEIISPGDNDAPDLVILGKNPKPEFIEDYHELLRKDRKERWLPGTIKRLKEIGFEIPEYSLDEQSKNLAVPHVLYDFIQIEKNLRTLAGVVQSAEKGIKPEEIRKNSHKFLNRYVYAVGKPCYLRRLEGFEVKDAIQLAEAMNCCAFIAHPGGGYGCLSDKTLDYFIKSGIHGIEVRNYFNTPEQNSKFDRLAEEHKLVRSGGSDYHGNNGQSRIGMHDRAQNQISKDVLESLWFSLPE